MRNKPVILPGVFALAVMMILLIGGCASQKASNNPSQVQPMKMSHAYSNVYDWEIFAPKSPYQVGSENLITFQLKERETGLPVRNLELAHEKKAHLILVSQDLEAFEHLHPEIIAPGKLQAKGTLPKAGQYVMYLQFSTPENGEQTLRGILQVGDTPSQTAVLQPDATESKMIDGYTFKLTDYPKKSGEMSMPTFNIEKDGKPVSDIKPYLGAGGHAVIISQDTETFLHVHPMAKAENGVYSSPLTFHTTVEKPGLYKLWGQFQIGEKLETVSFVFEVI